MESKQKIIRRSRWVDRDHTLEIDFLEEFDFLEATIGRVRAREEAETKKGKDREVGGRFFQIW